MARLKTAPTVWGCAVENRAYGMGRGWKPRRRNLEGARLPARLSLDDKKRDTQLNTSTPRHRDAEKIVNVLGIKQSWWQTTSILHAVFITLYLGWYLTFGLKYEGGAAEIIVRLALHMLAISGFVMLIMLAGIHLGVLMMMLHEWYREKLAARRRKMEATLQAAEETARAAEEARLAAEETARAAAEENRRAAETIAQIAAWNERRLHAQETGVPFDEPMPNGTNGAAIEQVRQEQAAYNAWFERRIAAAEKGVPFDEPPPNGTP